MKCINCNQETTPNSDFCHHCGSYNGIRQPAAEEPHRETPANQANNPAVNNQQPTAPASAPPPYRPGQVTVRKQGRRSPSPPHKTELGVGGYLGSLLLLFLPLLGILLAILWSILPLVHPSRRNLSRAFLLFLLLLFVLGALGLFLLSLFAPQTYIQLTQPLIQFFSTLF
ncbi:MAG: hypothetical protein ACOYI4_00745 [Christensenellales bacterium]|jgi:hypothetical protein